MGVFKKPDFLKSYISNGFEAMPGGFFIYRADANEEVIYANEVVLQIYECDSEEEFVNLTGGSFRGMVHPDDYEMVEKRINNQIKSDDEHYDQVYYRIMTKSNRIVYIVDYGRYIEDPDEGPLFYVFITSSRMKLDSLTGLPNDWYFLDLAGEGMAAAYAKGNRPAVLTFDLVGMKGFNSKFGRDEGDYLLIAFAEMLGRYFENNHCSRFGEDHFYAYVEESDGLETLINALIVELHEINFGKTLPVKVGIAKYSKDVTAAVLCDWARMAADSKKSFYGSHFSWFDEKMSEEYIKKEYILSNLDSALVDGRIQVYFQPVIRTLTGQLCSLESLVRWVDPVYGFISPGEFIPLLEENGLSYKVDRFVVNRVVDAISRRQKSKEHPVPCSVNISRTDFEVIDPVDMVARAADDHDIPRRLIYVEITESALTSDNGVVLHAIDRFHKAGFQVWMDDFGSGYSSLNVLKDYNFDEIKIDMVFMKNFDDRARKIVTMAVQMAKSLGIHTLAEGVETEEHIEFLKSIGCEKIQGYYYGKPVSTEDTYDKLKQRLLVPETREMMSFYDEVGLRDVVSDRPKALYLFNGTTFKSMYFNERYLEEITLIGENPKAALDWNMNSDESPLARRFRELAQITISTRHKENMTFIAKDIYFKFSFEMIAECREGVMFIAEIDGAVYNEMNENIMLDGINRNMLLLFDRVYIVDLEEDTRRVVISNLITEENGSVVKGIKEFYQNFGNRYVYLDDLKRYREFSTRDYLMKALNKSGRGSVSEYFRILQENGNYVWCEIVVMVLADEGAQRLLIGVKPAGFDADKVPAFAKRLSPVVEGEALLERHMQNDMLDALIQFSGIKFFWKDVDRRFVGASQAFLDYYRFESLDDIKGKTDEEIGWHLNDMPYQDHEKEVLEHGQIVRNSPGENVVDNVVHNILASKFPVYHDGKIDGLMGYFIDVEADTSIESDLGMASRIDEVTGLMNIRGFFMTLMVLDDNYRLNDEDYTVIIFDVPQMESVRRAYGENIAMNMIRTVGEKIRKKFTFNATVARVNGCSFYVCMRGNLSKQLSKTLDQLKESIDNITEVSGRMVNLHLLYGIAHGAEEKTFESVVDLAEERLKESRDIYQIKDVRVQSEQLDPYNELPLPFVVARPYMENGEYVDMEYAYVNMKYCEITGMRTEDYIGKRYFDIFPNTSKRWLDYGVRASKGEVIHDRAYGGAIGGVVDFVAAPSTKPGYAVFLFLSIDANQNLYQISENMLWTTEAIIAVLTKCESVLDFSETMNVMLEQVGQLLGADRAYILQTDRQTYSITYEWLNEGVSSIMPENQNRSYDSLEKSERYIEENSCIRVDNATDGRKISEVLYNYMRSHDIYNFIHVPISLDGVLIGYFGVDNHNISSNIDPETMMETLAKFIASKIYKREMYVRRLLVEEDVEEPEHIPTPVQSTQKSDREFGIRVAKILDSTERYEDSINHVLRLVGENTGVDRIAILERDGNIVNNTFEWCAEGITSEMRTLQQMDYEIFFRQWELQLKGNTGYTIESVESYRIINPNLYVTLNGIGARNALVTAYYNNGQVMGFIIACNYSEANLRRAKTIMDAIVYFVGAKLSAHHFQRINSFDDLTGVHNRNAMLIRQDELRREQTGSVGIIFADLNGLKEVNDRSGHEAGDRFIRNAAHVLEEIYGIENIYRSGGDEFMIILQDVTQEYFDELRQQLESRLSDPLAPKMAAGFAWASDISELDVAIQEADKKMYKDKNKFYQKHKRYRGE